MVKKTDLDQALIQLKQISFAWPGLKEPVLALDQLEVMPGERLFIYGPSGCGKSSLLSLLAGVVKPDQGQVRVLGQALTNLSSAARDRFRADHVGFVFQQFNLLPYLSVLENVTLACDFSPARRNYLKRNKLVAFDEAKRLLTRLNLPESLWQASVTQLSIGQQQRVAVARALIGSPPIIIADEPTSALDRNSRDQFLDLLTTEAEASGASLIFVSHDEQLQSHFSRIIYLPEINQVTSSYIDNSSTTAR